MGGGGHLDVGVAWEETGGNQGVGGDGGGHGCKSAGWEGRDWKGTRAEELDAVEKQRSSQENHADSGRSHTAAEDEGGVGALKPVAPPRRQQGGGRATACCCWGGCCAHEAPRVCGPPECDEACVDGR